MNPADARNLLLVQSIEESDPGETVLPATERDAASHAAGAPLPEGVKPVEAETFIVQRAQRLLGHLESRHEPVSALTHADPMAKFRGFAIGAILLAAAAGFLTNELGPEKKINILAFPLLGILLWNAVIYVRELIGFFRKSSPAKGDFASRLVVSRPPTVQNDDEPDEIRRGLSLFQKNWTRAILPVFAAKTKAVLHFAAAVLAAGAIAGMYVKGLANEYRAIWESTFFTAESLHPFLKILLGPASAISGISLPDLEGLRAMGGVDNPGVSAKGWIHLYAITIGLFIILPRTVLAIVWKSRSSAREKTIPFRSFAPAYFDRLLAVSTGKALELAILPYAHEPSSEARGRVQKKAEEIAGSAVHLTWLDPVSFGEEDQPLSIAENPPADLIFLLNFAATPERETHSVLLEKIRSGFPHTRLHI
ncbi:MAG: DUF2868 domain-containing protein, partial [Verrucomicrobiales bacterium]|nr:DUF2868 domain-containing protein [Verrucomicrobiales bacterium]